MSIVGTEVAAEVGKAITQQNWFKSMTFGQFVICVFLAAFLGGGYWGMNYAIPAHLTQIQSGYEAIEKLHAERQQTAHTWAADRDKQTADEREQWRKQIEKQWVTVERLAEKAGAGVKAAAKPAADPPGTTDAP